MLIFARGLWKEGLTTDSFITFIAEKICPDASEIWKTYLARRKALFSRAMRMCGYDFDFYMDFRWLPETTGAFGEEMARVYFECSTELLKAADELEAAEDASFPERVRELIKKEVGRGRFEAAELEVMSLQQGAMNYLGNFLNTGDKKILQNGIALLKKAVKALDVACEKARQAGLPEGSWYYNNINGWLRREFQGKIEKYSSVV